MRLPKLTLVVLAVSWFTELAAAPIVPLSVNANLPGEYIDVTWALSPGANNYQVEFSETGQGTKTRDVGNTNLFQQNVVRGRTYQYRVKACDVSGCSAFSSVASVAVPMIPDAPSKPSATLNGDTISVSWGAMPRATYYTRELWINGNSQGWLRQDSLSFNQTVSPGNTYEFIIKACNLNLCSAHSPASTAIFVPQPKPPAQQGAPSATNSGQLITVRWSAATSATYYLLEPYKNDLPTGQIRLTNVFQYQFTGEPGAKYQFLTKACNAHGCSPYSTESNVLYLPAVRYTVNGTAGSGGTISPSSQEVNAGTSTSLTVTPNTGFTAAASGCGGRLSGTTYTTGAITSACTVTATFSQQSYLVSTTAGANGTISAGKTVNHGQTTSFTVTPNAGYTAVVSGCGGSLSGTTYTTGAITSACTVTATFTAQSSTQINYLHTDVLGSVVMETDANGNVKKRTEYKPFGESKDQ